MLNAKGQVILILIVIMTVALAIGLSVVQKSLIDVSTASKVEQSSRAFSAAEAGIEKAISSESPVGISDLGNNSKIDSVNMREVPEAGQALEYPPLAKEEVAQVWLANYNSSSNPPTTYYTQNSLDVYWGNSPTDKAAIELTLVYYNSTESKYASIKWYLDSGPRVDTNGFDGVPCTGYSIGSNPYQCYKRLENLPTSGLMLIRARLLYNSTSQAFAVKPTSGYSLPPQARLFASTGSSGETQRKIQVFQLYKVVPPYFDYGIFSAGEINK